MGTPAATHAAATGREMGTPAAEPTDRAPPATELPVAERVVDAAWAAFERLPAKCKPVTANGRTQWVPCSAVVVSSKEDTVFDCMSLATGAKCLAAAKVAAAHGQVLHDGHAEVLALRVFNAVLLRECAKLARDRSYRSALVEWRAGHDVRPRTNAADDDAEPPFQLRAGLRLYLYCSEAPCGDASMELVMAQQADATPWPSRGNAGLLGRGHFSELGVVRRKPARADSPLTLSKSCSDKLALRQSTSALSSVAALWLRPERAYLHALVLPARQAVPAALRRAFAAEGRMQPVAGATWGGGFAFRPFRVLTTEREFAFSRRVVDGGVSNIGSTWSSETCEALINGILVGRKVTDPRRASMASRAETWRTSAAVLDALERRHVVAGVASYIGVKAIAALAHRRQASDETIRRALAGWVPNEIDDFPICTAPQSPS